MTGPAVDVRNLTLRFGETVALDNVSLAINPGEVVAVMGPSGSGKSTLLHCIAGLLRPDHGDIRVAGHELGQLSDRARSALRLHSMGIVSQFGDLVPELTLRENVELPMRLGSRRRARRAASDAQDVLDRLQVAQVADRRAGEASGGQVQRTAVARALAHQPNVVLADEPTGALDTVTGELVLEALLTHARRAQAAVLLITHEARIAAHADREVVMRDGALVESADMISAGPWR